MVYIVTKIIKGNPYLYEVKSVREGDRVRQVFVRYLGRADKPGREYSETEPVERKERIRRPAVATISEAVTPTVAVEAEKLEPKTFTFRGLHFRDIEGGIGLQAQDPNTKEWIDTAVVNRKNLETNYANVPDITLWKDRTPETTIKFPEAIAPPTEEVAAPVERTGQEMRAIRDRLQGERMGWQVPQAEFINIESEVSGSPITPDFSESMVDTHKSLIQKAIREGEDVPTDVLKDYPELTPKPTPTAVEITPTPVTKEPWEITRAEYNASIGKVNTDKIYYHATTSKEKFNKFTGNEVWFDTAPRDYGENMAQVQYDWKKPFITSLQEAKEQGFEITPEQVAKNKETYEKLGGEANPKTFEWLREQGYDVVLDNEGYAALYPERVRILDWAKAETEFVNPNRIVKGFMHKAFVEKAIKKGKQVSPEVLKDYPELSPEPVPAPVAKEPWEMTKAERATYIEQKGKEAIQKWNESGGKGFPPSNPERWGVSEVNKAADELGMPWGEGRVAIPQHKYEVMVALKQGKPIPLEVLKDYPELTPKPAPEVMVTPTEPEITPVTPEVELYHGTVEEFADTDIVGGKRMFGIHLTTDESVAKTYSGKTGSIKKYSLASDAKVLDLSDGDTLWEYMKKEGILDAEDIADADLENYVKSGQLYQYDISSKTYLADDVAKTAKSQGYDVVKMADNLGGGDNVAYVVVNKDKLAIPKAEAGMPEVTKAVVTPTAPAVEPIIPEPIVKELEIKEPTPKEVTVIPPEITTTDEIKATHVTSNPQPVIDALKFSKNLGETRGEGLVGDLGVSGLYVSNNPQMWIGRATSKWHFLKELTPEQKDKLIGKVIKSVDEQMKYGGIADFEYQNLMRDINYVKEGKLDAEVLVSAANQPFNIAFWKPEYLSDIGIEQTNLPIEVPVTAKGKFADVTKVKGGMTQDLIDSLKAQGYDGMIHRGSWGTPEQTVIWNPKAIESFGEYTTEQPIERELTPEIPTDATILEKDFNRMSHKEVVEELKSQGKPLLIDDITKLDKLANYRQGYKPDIDRPVLVHRAIEHGIMTDGFLLVESQEATKQVIGKFLKNEESKEARKIQKLNPNLSKEEAEATARELFEGFAKQGTFPDYKRLYPSELGKEAKLVGVYAGGIEGIEVPHPAEVLAYLSDGENIIAVNADKLAFVRKHLPDAKVFLSTKNPTISPVTFMVDDERKGLLMPMETHGNIPPIIQEKALGTIPTKVEEPAPEPVKEAHKPVKVNPEMAEEVLEGYRDLEEAREVLSDFADRDVVGYTARGQEVTPDMLRQAIDIKSVEPKIKQEPNINALLAHLREAPQSKSTESYLRKTFGDEAIDQAHQDRLVTRTPKGIYTITVSGRETIKSIPSGKVNLYAEGKRILAESITIKPETQEATFEQNITKAVEERPSRISHGYTAKNAFYITKDNRIIPANEFSQVSKGDDIISVHSHSGENWEQYTREHGQESFQPPNAADFDHLRWLVKQGYGNKLAVIMGDGRYIQVEIPEPAQPRFTRMGRKTLEKLLYPESKGASDAEHLAKLKATAKEEGWLLTEGNWKA